MMEIDGSITYKQDKQEKKDKKENSSFTSPIGHEAYASQEQDILLAQASRKGSLDPRARVPDSAPRFNQDEVKRAIWQFFDNGEGHPRRYQFKMRINLYPEGNEEFIANMTKSLQDFKRHIPGPNKRKILDLAMVIRRDVKNENGYFPFIGKYHLKSNTRNINIEPDTFVALWWNRQQEMYQCISVFYDWETYFELDKDRLTAKQKESNVKCQYLYINPKYDDRPRPLTFAQRRALGI